MDYVKAADFRRSLETAVQQRQTHYSDAFGLTIRWERDDTEAGFDTIQFQTLMTILQLPAPKELIIAASDPSPGWTVTGEFWKIMDSARATKGRALVIVHYAGHGRIGDSQTLRLVEHSLGGREICSWRSLMASVEPEGNFQDNVDFLFIFDSCYAFQACRAPCVAPRIVEVIAATDEQNPEALARPANTITRKLVTEIRRRRDAGHHWFDFADVVESIRAQPGSVKRPTHALKMGAASICLRFSGLTTIDPSAIPPKIRVAFSVKIVENMTKEDADRFIRAIHMFPENAALTLDGVYPAQSTLLILTSAWSVWSKLSGMRGYALLAEITGGNILQDRPATSLGPAKKENVPPERKHLR